MKVVEISRLVVKMVFIFFVFFASGIIYAESARFQHADNQSEYFKNRSLEPPEKFVVSGLIKIPDVGKGKIAIDLGSSIGNETKFLLQKGYKVIAVDSNAEALRFMRSQPGVETFKSNLTTIHSTFEKLDFTKLPQTDLIVASFSLPFVHYKEFNRVWGNVISTIKPGGHIIVNLFDPGFTFFNNKPNMSFHTKKEALDLFSRFKIIEFRAMRNDPQKPGTKNHYYVIIAKKLY